MLVLAVGVPIAAFAVMSDGSDNAKVAVVAPTTNVSAETSTTTAPRAIEILSVVPAEPSVGETVTFTVRATTPNCGVDTSFGRSTRCGRAVRCAARER